MQDAIERILLRRANELEGIQSKRLPAAHPAQGNAMRTVWAKDLPLHAGRQRQEIKQVCERLPDSRAPVFSEALVVEPIDLHAAFIVSLHLFSRTRVWATEVLQVMSIRVAHLRDLPTLMVSPDDSNPLWKPHFHRYDHGNLRKENNQS